MTKRIHVNIIKETKKAALVESAEGRKAWVQKHWLAADGTVNAKTFERQANEYAEDEREREKERAFRNEWHDIGQIERESEKAVAVVATWYEPNTDQTGRMLVWFPKSQIQDGKVQGWLIAAKAKDVRERITSINATFEITIAGHEFWM